MVSVSCKELGFCRHCDKPLDDHHANKEGQLACGLGPLAPVTEQERDEEWENEQAEEES